MSRETAPELNGRTSRRRQAWLFLRDILVIVLIALLASFLIKTFLVRSFYIPSASMQNTLQVGDRILVNELVPDAVPLNRGDAVVFTDPGGWLPTAPPEAAQGVLSESLTRLGMALGVAPDELDNDLVKRVIGLPGDHVVCCNALGQMSVNDRALAEPYVLLPAGITRVAADDFDVTVPEGALWVMGDNRYNSRDSRYNRQTPSHGFVPISNVVGRAVLVTWPLNRLAWLDDYPRTFGSD